MRSLTGMGLLSAAVLLLQVALTRVFSIAQFYHFAFLVVSLALLGFGASGSLLALWPRLKGDALGAWYALGFGVSAVLAYLLVNHLAFDSYSIAWDRTQVYLLIANLLGLAVPFAFAGALIGALLSGAAERAGLIYGANLLGSAAGAVIAPLVISALSSEQAVLVAVLLGMVAALILAGRERRRVTAIAAVGLVGGVGLLAGPPAAFEIQPSPYKALSQFRLNPDAQIIDTEQNAYSRLDLVDSPTIHSAQGLSLTYFGNLPPQYGLLIDGDNLLPVSNADRTSESLLEALPASVAYTVRPEADALVLNAGGGMDALAALANGAQHVTVVEPNNLIYRALKDELREWAGLASDPRVTLRHDEVRTYVQQSNAEYDIVQLSLTDNYRPISSGAFTLTEDYTLTVEAIRSYLALCGDDGILVMNRWLQTPPSESLRTLAMIIEALDQENPLQHMVVFRSFQHATLIVKPTPLTAGEVDMILGRVEQLRYDLVIAPEMPDTMINQYARLDAPVYHETFLELVTAEDRPAFYERYDFEVSPPTDNRPFFFHFFRWRQTPEILQSLGRRWQPFGGSGYFVLIALLAFAVAAALIFVLLPIALRRRFRRALAEAGTWRSARTLAYFTAIGLSFFLVEVSLIQKYILVVGRPTIAIATVIGALLLFSGIGSSVSDRFNWRYSMPTLIVLLIVYPFVIDGLKPLLLSLPLVLRMAATGLLIAPVGFLMGMPFPHGITTLQDVSDLIPWAWAANGSASVVSAVLAATLALSEGFTLVLLTGAGLYLLAAVIRSRE